MTDPAPTDQTGLVRAQLETADAELARVASLDEARDLADKAALAAEYARRVRLGTPLINHAMVIRLLAEVLMAEFVNAGQAEGRIAIQGQHASPPGDGDGSGPASLLDLGIDDRRLAEARRIRRDFTDSQIRELGREATDNDKILVRATLLRAAPKPAPQGPALEWYTPRPYIEAARTVLGAIDLDPCSCEEANQTVGAAAYYDADTDGLTQDWKGRVWLSPPEGRAGIWVARLAEEFAAGQVDAAVALVTATATDTEWFRVLWDHLLCFSDGRIPLLASDGTASAPTHGSVFAYLGREWAKFTAVFGEFGAVVSRYDA